MASGSTSLIVIFLAFMLVRPYTGQSNNQTALTAESNMQENWKVAIEEEKTKQLILYIVPLSIFLTLLIILLFAYKIIRSLLAKVSIGVKDPEVEKPNHDVIVHAFPTSNSSGQIESTEDLSLHDVHPMQCNLTNCSRDYCKRRALPHRPISDVRLVEEGIQIQGGSSHTPALSDRHQSSPANDQDKQTGNSNHPVDADRECVLRRNAGRNRRRTRRSDLDYNSYQYISQSRVDNYNYNHNQSYYEELITPKNIYSTCAIYSSSHDKPDVDLPTVREDTEESKRQKTSYYKSAERKCLKEMREATRSSTDLPESGCVLRKGHDIKYRDRIFPILNPITQHLALEATANSPSKRNAIYSDAVFKNLLGGDLGVVSKSDSEHARTDETRLHRRDTIEDPVDESGSSLIFCMTEGDYMHIPINPCPEISRLSQQPFDPAESPVITADSRNLYTQYSGEPIVEFNVPRPEVYPVQLSAASLYANA